MAMTCFFSIYPLRKVVLTTVVRPIRYSLAGVWPITFSARRQAAACGAGSGGSWGAKGGVSRLEETGIFALRMCGLLFLNAHLRGRSSEDGVVTQAQRSEEHEDLCRISQTQARASPGSGQQGSSAV